MTTDELDTIRHASRFDGATFNAGTARALLAELDAARAREVELTDAIDSLLSLITGETGENCDVQRAIEALSETRAQFEARILKRDAKLREALRETPCHLDCADFPREKWCLRCAALAEGDPHA